MIKLHILKIGTGEVHALRSAAEYWGDFVTVTWVGNSSQIVEYFSHYPDHDLIIISGHGSVRQPDQEKERHRENIDGDVLAAHSGLAQELPDPAGLLGLLIESSSHDQEQVTLSPPTENHMLAPEGQVRAEAQKWTDN